MGRMLVLGIGIVFGLTYAFGADDEKHVAVKKAEAWLYPSAKTGSSSQSGSISCVVQQTTDDVPAILMHYGKKIGIDLEKFARHGIAGGGVDSRYFVLSSPVESSQDGSSTHVLTMMTKNACVTAVIERPRDAKSTTVTVSVVPLVSEK
jgi:hypothetical protein